MGKETSIRGIQPLDSREADSRKLVASMRDVSFTTYDRTLFYDVNFNLHQGQTVAVTGESGCGKTVLLKILMGNEHPDTGEVTITKGTTVSYVPQEVEDLDVGNDTSVIDLFLKARGLDTLEQNLRVIEDRMSQDDTDPSELEKAIDQYGRLQEEYENRGGYTAHAEIDAILEGLGVDEKSSGHINHQTKLSQVSSGQRTRLLLGQALFASSNMLVLDNPTAHLDVKAVQWLASYIKSSSKAILVATQDTDFADACCNRIVEITDFGRVLTFEGNYSQFVLKKDSILEAERKAAEAAREKLEKLNSTYLKFKGEGVFRRSADMAQVGRAFESRISRMEDELANMSGVLPTYRENKVRDLSFQPQGKGGTVSFRDLNKSYDGFRAVDITGIDVTVKRGQLLHVSGENGTGKSTLLRMIAASCDLVSFDSDRRNVSVADNMVVGYYAPDRLGISRKGSVFEEIVSAMLNRNEGEASAILQFFGFPHQGLRQRNIETLSGGEKRQLALAKIMALHPDILLLDEPTDGLKPEVIDRLASAVSKFEGAAIVVSHDPKFIDLLDPDLELSLQSKRLMIKKS